MTRIRVTRIRSAPLFTSLKERGRFWIPHSRSGLSAPDEPGQPHRASLPGTQAPASHPRRARTAPARLRRLSGTGGLITPGVAGRAGVVGRLLVVRPTTRTAVGGEPPAPRSRSVRYRLGSGLRSDEPAQPDRRRACRAAGACNLKAATLARVEPAATLCGRGQRRAEPEQGRDSPTNLGIHPARAGNLRVSAAGLPPARGAGRAAKRVAPQSRLRRAWKTGWNRARPRQFLPGRAFAGELSTALPGRAAKCVCEGGRGGNFRLGTGARPGKADPLKL